MSKTRLQKLQSDFKKHEQESEELAVAIKNEHHEERIKKLETLISNIRQTIFSRRGKCG